MPPDEALLIPVPGQPAPIPSNGAQPQETHVTPMDATIATVLDQAFAKSHQVGLRAADRASAGDDNLAELSRHIHLGEVSKVGTREAAAMQRMDTDKLSKSILDARNVAGQPQIVPIKV